MPAFTSRPNSASLPARTCRKFEPWVRHWNRAVSRAYLQAYCQSLDHSGILPTTTDKLRMMLLAYLLNQVVDELGDELRLHSDNVRAPLPGSNIFLLEEPFVASKAGPGGDGEETQHRGPKRNGMCRRRFCENFMEAPMTGKNYLEPPFSLLRI